MKCKKCGEELTGDYAFCPKCGKKISQKKGVEKILTILLLFIAVIGIGVGFYLSKNMKQPETVVVENNVSENASVDSSDVQIEPEVIVKEVDEMEEFFLSLSFEPIEMIMGETHQIQLEKKMTDAVWISSDEKIVQITDGVIKALTPGTATITVSVGDNQKCVEVGVNPFSDMTLAVNCFKTLELNDVISDVRWESSAPEVVSVSEGTINSLSAGASTITAYIDEIPYSFEVVATTPDISTTSVRKIIGNTQQISIMGTNGQVEWKSDNTAIATVSDTGLITAEPTGAGQTTVVHAYVDGMEFKVDVEVEPIPQLSSTYKIYGYQNDNTYKNAKITLCANANEIVKRQFSELGGWNCEIKDVINVAEADYSDGMTYPLYRTFARPNYDENNYTHTEVYLMGTSQKAEVLIKQFPLNTHVDELQETDSIVTYEACEDYGIIHIYDKVSGGIKIITVSIDGYKYEFAVADMADKKGYGRSAFFYDMLNAIPQEFVIEECSVDEIITHQATDSSALVANSRTYHTNNDWIERVGTKFVQELEDQAIEMVAGAVLKWLLPF